jgi:MHS family proline/betaine transporter-like MFS transporter
MFIRITMPETLSFQKIQKEKLQNRRYPISVLIKDSNAFKSLLIVIGLASSWGVFYQILFIWMPTYLIHLNLDYKVALQLNCFFVFFLACLILGIGYIADTIKRKLILKISCFSMLFLSFPLFTLLASGSLWKIYFAMSVFTFIFSLYLPTAFVSMIELFNTEIRYTGLSLGFNIGLAIFGGTCPLIATWLIEVSGNNSSPAFYLMIAAICALLISSLIPEKSGQEI